MKPRIRKVASFWRCTTPEAQGIGITPELAFREYMRVWLERMEDRVRRDRERHEQAIREQQQQMRALWLQQQIRVHQRIWGPR